MRNCTGILVGAVGALVVWCGALAAAEAQPLAAAGEGGERVTFTDKPQFMVLPRPGAAGAVECAVYAPRQAAPRGNGGVLLHLYGRGGSCRDYNMMRPSYATLRRRLWERGYWLIVPDLGTDHWMNNAACASLDAIIDGMVQDRGADPARIHLLGTSMGGGSALVYVMRRPDRIRSVCAVFPMTDFTVWTQEQPGYLAGIMQAHGATAATAAALLRDLSPLQHVAAFAGVPVFLLHGGADDKVPIHHSREFAAALAAQGSAVTCREVAGMAHDDAIAAAFQEEIAAFLTGTAQPAAQE
jgi:dipeptidyl aminopeptidase/acylaminoacyl peptidase